MAEFGTGYPLYFEFVLYCIIMLIIMLVFLGTYAMITNYISNDCQLDGFQQCSDAWINQISIPNKIFHEEYYYIQTWFNLATIIVVMISLHYFRRMQRLTENECDRGLISASDYSIWLSKLPKGQYTESEIRHLVESSIPQDKNHIQIKKIVMAFEVSDFKANCDELNRIEAYIIKCKEYEFHNNKWPEGESLDMLQKEKDDISRKIDAFLVKSKNSGEGLIDKTSGDVFVIFAEQNGNIYIYTYI